MTSVVKTSELIQSIRYSDFPYENLDALVSNKGSNFEILITDQNINETERFYLFDILNVLGVSDNVDIDKINFGVASYRDESFSYHNPMHIGYDVGVDQGKHLSLKIGTNAGEKIDRNASSIVVNIEVDFNEKKLGARTVKEAVYSINGVELSLHEEIITNPDGSSYTKHYLAFFDTEGDTKYLVPFLPNKDELPKGDNTSKIRKLWKDGNFVNLVRHIDEVGGASRVWCEANKMFVELFQDGKFPYGGVYFLVRKGKIKTIPSGTFNNQDNDIVKADWEIVDCSHPELLVTHWSGKSAERVSKQIPLCDVTNIQFTTAKNNNEGYNFLLKCEGSFSGYALLWVKDINQNGNVKHMPQNIITTKAARIRYMIKNHTRLLENALNHIADNTGDNLDAFDLVNKNVISAASNDQEYSSHPEDEPTDSEIEQMAIQGF